MGTRPVLVVALAVLAGSPAARADEELDIPGLEATDLHGDALVWEDATFYLEPWDNGLSVRLGSMGRPRTDEVGRAIPVRITSSRMRTFVEIDLPDRLDCVSRRWVPDRRVDALRVFVKREDLAPVLTRPFTAAGGRVKLAPGVAVAPTANGMYAISARGDRIRLPIPHAAVGYVYTATKVTEPELPAKVVGIDRGVTIRVLGEEFQSRVPWLSPEPAKTTETAVLKWATRCIELAVDVPPTAVHPMTKPRTPLAPSVPTYRPTGFYIPAGAPLSTPGGREVAVAAIPIPVGAPAGDTICFEANLSVAKIDDMSYPPFLTRTVRLCTPARLVGRD